MDWKVLGSTFVAIFLAELGDKTQLATFGLAAGSESRLAVFVGAALALVAASAVAVLFAQVAGSLIPDLWLRRGAGVLFLVLGVVFLVSSD
ncbi:MAG: TMEM165/GDT1 family protein [Myxococcota bacterium]